MLVLRTSCHFPALNARHVADRTAYLRVPPATFRTPDGSLLSVREVHPSPLGVTQGATVAESWFPRFPPGHCHQASTPTSASTSATAPTTHRWLRRGGPGTSPRNDANKLSTSWCQASSCSTTAWRWTRGRSSSGRSAVAGRGAP